MLAHLEDSSVVKLLKITELIVKYKKIIIIALVVMAIPSYFIYDYTQHNPKFCITCHLMDEAYDTWDVSAMHDLDCHSCHESDIVTSMDHLREVIFENPQEVTKMTEIDNELCEHCHESNDPQWLQILGTAGHEVHVIDRNQPPDCIDCHGLRLHIFRPAQEVCSECHGEENNQPVEDMDIHCIVCHEFLATEHELIPEQGECLSCHEAQDTMGVSFPSDAHADTPCMNCHQPNEEAQHIECIVCHEIPEEGIHTTVAHSNCATCHIPHSSDPMRDNCLSCHLDREDHFSPTECIICHSGS